MFKKIVLIVVLLTIPSCVHSDIIQEDSPPVKSASVAKNNEIVKSSKWIDDQTLEITIEKKSICKINLQFPEDAEPAEVMGSITASLMDCVRQDGYVEQSREGTDDGTTTKSFKF